MILLLPFENDKYLFIYSPEVYFRCANHTMRKILQRKHRMKWLSSHLVSFLISTYFVLVHRTFQSYSIVNLSK